MISFDFRGRTYLASIYEKWFGAFGKPSQAISADMSSQRTARMKKFESRNPNDNSPDFRMTPMNRATQQTVA
jgi:hypothetical protein